MAGLAQVLAQSMLGLGGGFDDDADATIVIDLDKGPTEAIAFMYVNADASIRYLHLWDSAAPSGTPMDYTLPLKASGTTLWTFLPPFPRFDIALSYMVTSDTGTSASTNPTTPGDLYFVTTGGVLRALGAEETGAGPADADAALQTLLSGSQVSRLRYNEKATGTARSLYGSSGTLHMLQCDNRNNASAYN